MTTKIEYRRVHVFGGDIRQALENALQQCRHENGGKLVGEPSISFNEDVTVFEFTQHSWWDEYMRIHLTALARTGVADLLAGHRNSGQLAPASDLQAANDR